MVFNPEFHPQVELDVEDVDIFDQDDDPNLIFPEVDPEQDIGAVEEGEGGDILDEFADVVIEYFRTE